MRKAVAVLGTVTPESIAAPGVSSPNHFPVAGRLRARYDREVLYDRVWQAPLRTVAREYGVSDVALAKTCRKLNVPVPGRGYWAKRAAHLLVSARPPLPALK